MILCVALAAHNPATADDGAAFLRPPSVPGWHAERSNTDPLGRMPNLADVVLMSADGRSRVIVSVRPFSASPHPVRGSSSAILTSATWLPQTTVWVPTAGPSQCFRSRALGASPDPAFAVWGQARCRRRNFIVLYTFASKEKDPPSWRQVLPRVVARTTTASECLTPEETTYLADFEGPPFVVRRPDARTVDVAARSMCGTGGCPYWRHRRDGPCFRFVGIVRGWAE